MRKTVRLGLRLALFIVGLQQIAYGCICRSDVLPCEEYQAAEAIFVGTVLDVKPRVWKTNGQTYRSLPGITTFQVRQVFKGKLAEVLAFSQSMFDDCLPSFQRGETWLVYASRDKKLPDAGLVVRSCSRNALLRDAAVDIAYLEKISANPNITRLQGSLRYDDLASYLQAVSKSTPLQSLAGIRIEVRKGDGIFESFTDENGLFEINGLLSGQYQVTPQLPKSLEHAREHPTTIITIQQSSCGCLDFVVKPKSE